MKRKTKSILFYKYRLKCYYHTFLIPSGRIAGQFKADIDPKPSDKTDFMEESIKAYKSLINNKEIKMSEMEVIQYKIEARLEAAISSQIN